MITEKDREDFAKITSNPQSGKIAMMLNAAGKRTLKGLAYKGKTVSNVFHGKLLDPIAENFIFRHYKELKDYKEETEQLRKELTEAPDPKAIEVNEPETLPGNVSPAGKTQ